MTEHDPSLSYEFQKLTAKQFFSRRTAAAQAVPGRFLLRIRLRLHNHTPQQLAILLAFYQQAADELRRNLLGGAGEEGWGGPGKTLVAMGVASAFVKEFIRSSQLTRSAYNPCRPPDATHTS